MDRTRSSNQQPGRSMSTSSFWKASGISSLGELLRTLGWPHRAVGRDRLPRASGMAARWMEPKPHRPFMSVPLPGNRLLATDYVGARRCARRSRVQSGVMAIAPKTFRVGVGHQVTVRPRSATRGLASPTARCSYKFGRAGDARRAGDTRPALGAAIVGIGATGFRRTRDAANGASQSRPLTRSGWASGGIDGIVAQFRREPGRCRECARPAGHTLLCNHSPRGWFALRRRRACGDDGGERRL